MITIWDFSQLITIYDKNNIKKNTFFYWGMDSRPALAQ